MLPNGVAVNYTYDVASELTGIAYQAGLVPLGNLTYGYDLAGHRNGVTGSLAHTGLPNAVGGAAYNANNQLTQWGSAALTYDANGNTLNDGANAYSWNARNQLTAMGAMTFQYDGLGRRIKNGRGTNFLYDGMNVVQEQSNGTPTANLLSGGVDEVFLRSDSTGTWSFLTDGLGSTVALTDSIGTVQTQYTYESFGNTTVTGAASSNSFQYTGRENDGSGLYYYRARYYNPNIGRFLSEDPIRFTAGIDFYAYTLNDPIRGRDPSGLWFGLDDLITSGLGALSGVGGQAISDLLSGKLSSWCTYVGAAVGGAVAGEVLDYTLNPWLAGAAGGAAGNLTKQSLNDITSGRWDKPADLKDLAQDTAVGTVSGGLSPDTGHDINDAVTGAIVSGVVDADSKQSENNGPGK
jgi:RHS repeat-associated protein